MEYYFEIQKRLMELLVKTNRFDCSPLDLDTLKGQDRARKQIFYICHEMHEAASELHIKKWRGTGTMKRKEEFYKELVDSFVFFIEFLILLKITPESFRILFDSVEKKNFNRLEEPLKEIE